MSVSSFEELMCHVGHKIVIASYGDDVLRAYHIFNVAIECEDCNVVILDYDRPEESE